MELALHSMLKCPVCLSENDPFTTICAQCGGFLQNRVPNLNLFETLWGVLESPSKTFPKIVLAEHKNFSILLFALFGVSIAFTAFWFFNIGRVIGSLPELIVLGLGFGLVGGIVMSPFIAVAYHGTNRLLGGVASFRTGYSLLAYATAPAILSLFLILPIELMTFGMYLFTSNPHPYVIKPVSYVLLLSFDVVVGLWTLWLVIKGTHIAYRVRWIPAIGSSLVALLVLAAFVGSVGIWL
jgi:hypothetical protein